MIALVDYGAGNLTSVRYAFASLGVEAEATHDPEAVAAADRVVFPGVGAAGRAMENLKTLGLDAAVCAAAASGKPFLGICLGMQILFERSDEDGGVDTLGILPGRVRRFPRVDGFKVPEIGWNGEYYYVHSYYAEICPYTVLTATHAGVEFTALVKRGRLWASQFHPEKSGRLGLEFLKEWLSC